jgi:GDP-mannose 6-dehydrogenase
VVKPVLERFPQVSIVSNPEFLREGSAVKDFFEPSLLVVGGTDAAAVDRMSDLYSALPVKACKVSLRTAEMIKYACNSFHAVKIAFANEIGTLAANLGVSPQEVMETLCQDVKLNVSTAYLKPGFAFGGSCLPKDLRALVYRGSRLDLKLPLLESSLPSNEEHLRRATQKVMELKGECIGIYGLSFKENTDDLRESPVIHMLESLIGKGRNVRIFDPHISLEAIYGSNRSYALNSIPHIGKLMEPSLDSLLACAQHIVLTQKPAQDAAAVIAQSGLPILKLYEM